MFAAGRLDAKYHLSQGVVASERMVLLEAGGAILRPVAGAGGLGRIDPTSRMKRVYAVPGEDAVPYLRPYDIFDYLPQSADLLSKRGSEDIDSLVPESGTILQTCSGRNLGPLALVDHYISRFAVSDDMLRLHIDDQSNRYYALAFLSTPTGQALLTRSKTGNVIDHLSARDLGSVPVPFFDDGLKGDVVRKIGQAVVLRERARIRLDELIRDAEADIRLVHRVDALHDGWTQSAADLSGRLDAAFYDPHVKGVRSTIKAAGGVRLQEVAELEMPGQYKRYYVEQGHGRPILSGRQLLQSKPINLQYLAPRAVEPASYELKPGMIVFGGRGRAEERLAQPALVTEDRSGWLASHNVVRARPRPGVNPGWLYLSLALPSVQVQIQARAFGSVVDVVEPDVLSDVLLPVGDAAAGPDALQCWLDFAAAIALEADAVGQLEGAILGRAGVFVV